MTATVPTSEDFLTAEFAHLIARAEASRLAFGVAYIEATALAMTADFRPFDTAPAAFVKRAMTPDEARAAVEDVLNRAANRRVE